MVLSSFCLQGLARSFVCCPFMAGLDQVILDGIDEASDVKGVLQSYIMRRLVPMQISLVLTSRPEGVSADLGTLRQSFAIMSLKPLSDEQQKQIILNQVKNEGNKFFEKLMKFAETWTCTL